jgi:uncharacterized protein YlzI (FlbEa/FlbD family)
MILLHRLAHTPEPFHVNPELIAIVEAAPDTHVTLTTGTKLVVAEPVELVVQAIRDWHVDVAARAMSRASASFAS